MSRLLVVLALVSGCSLTFQKKPTKTSAATCSDSYAFAVADGIVAASAAGAAAYGIYTRPDGAYLAAAGALGAVLFLASATNGASWSHECIARRDVAVAAR